MKDLSNLSDDQLYAMANIAPPELVRSVMYEESRGNPDAVSPKGAKGRMQVMDATNRDPGYGVRPAADNSKAERERVGKEYLGMLYGRYQGDPYLTAAAYNAGPGRVDKLKAAGKIDQLPAETRKYAPKVVAGMAKTDDLSKMSDQELAAIAGVDLSKASDAELRQMAGLPETPAAPAAPQAPFMARVGRGAMDKLQGMKQAYMKLQADLGIIDPDLPRQYTEQVNQELANYQKSAPSGIDWARIAGGAAAEAPLYALPGGPVAQGLTGGFISGATNFVPSGSDQDRMSNALIGAGLGGGIAAIVPGVRSMLGNKANQTMQQNVALARQLGINPRPSQFTDNAVARRFEMMLDTMPGGAAAFKGADKKNVEALNNAVLGVFGKGGKEISPAMVKEIDNQIDNLYSTALGGTPIKWDRSFILELNRLTGEIKKLPKELQDQGALNLLNDPKFRRSMDAETYNQIRSELGRQAKNAFASKNSTLGRTMEDVQTAMDDWAMRNLPPQQSAALAEARSQYRSWQVVDKALDPMTGNVSPAKLSNAAVKNDPLIKRGASRREISEVAQAASTIAKTPPDSGSAARFGAGWRGYPAATVAGAGGVLGGLPGAMIGLGVALPGAYGVGRAYLSPTAQAAARALEEQAGMLAPRAGILAGGAASQP